MRQRLLAARAMVRELGARWQAQSEEARGRGAEEAAAGRPEVGEGGEDERLVVRRVERQELVQHRVQVLPRIPLSVIIASWKFSYGARPSSSSSPALLPCPALLLLLLLLRRRRRRCRLARSTS